jgi:uncharacterized glyoxalase superfamily protein PhnB
VRPDPAFGLLKLYDDALPHVYGYLLARCRDTGLAKDLTAESSVGLVRRGVGAQRRCELHLNADGTIGHAEVGIGDAVLMFAEASDLWPDVPVSAPDSPATFSHTLHLEVDDVDASTERARRSGASVEREPGRPALRRGSVIVDPFGHRWERSPRCSCPTASTSRPRSSGSGRRPCGRARTQAAWADSRVYRRPGRLVPPLAARRPIGALARDGEHEPQVAVTPGPRQPQGGGKKAGVAS